MLPHYLKAAGYRSYHSGKWHVRAAEDVVAQGGFDRSYKISDQDRFFSPRSVALDDKNQPPVKNDGSFYATEAIGEYGVKFLSEHQEQHADKPFFMYLAVYVTPFSTSCIAGRMSRNTKRLSLMVGTLTVSKRLKFLKESGLLPECRTLTPGIRNNSPRWNLDSEKLREAIGPGEVSTAVAWETLTDEQKEFQAVKMSIHAAMIDRMDQVIWIGHETTDCHERCR